MAYYALSSLHTWIPQDRCRANTRNTGVSYMSTMSYMGAGRCLHRDHVGLESQSGEFERYPSELGQSRVFG